ncbi:MAG TPA: hypothetical protein VK063_07415 [Beutenbergiaceae bacterium]|nr:hypothetical protein [Beutenbergiaceae bacterium]
MAKSTLGNVRDAPSRSSVWLRRLALGALLSVLILSLTGLLGNMNRTVTTTEQDFTLSLEYPRVARAGLDVPWELTISAPGGFGQEEVVVRASTEYFSLFQFHDITPQPEAESTDGTFTYWRFSAPAEAEELVVSVNHTVKPRMWSGASGTVGLMVDGQVVAPLEFTTTLIP